MAGMRYGLGAALVCGLFLSACGDDGGTDGGSDGGGLDASGLDATVFDDAGGMGDAGPADTGGPDDATVPDADTGDAAVAREVTCGELTCTGSTFCCTEDLGRTGFCGMFPEGCGPGLVPNHCDGPEDCIESGECCRAGGMGNACLPDGTCDTLSGEVLCHMDEDCGGGVCCPASPDSPWSVCSDAPC